MLPEEDEHWPTSDTVLMDWFYVHVVARGPSVGDRLHLSHEAPKRKARRVVCISRFTKKLAINLRPVCGRWSTGPFLVRNK